MNEARARSISVQVSGEPLGIGVRCEFLGGEYGGDLRMGFQLLQFAQHGLALRGGQREAEVEIAERPVGGDQRVLARDAELRGDRLAHLGGQQRRVDPRGARQCLLDQPFRQVDPAVIGGQHCRIVDFPRVEVGQQRADGGVQLVHLDAHLGALAPRRMADVVGDGEADRKHVGRGSLAEIEFVDELHRQIGGRRVKAGRDAKAQGIAGGALEPTGTDADRSGGDSTIVSRAIGRQGHRGLRLRQFGGDLGIGGARRWPQFATEQRGKARSLPPIDLIDQLSAHHQRAAILARHGNVA